MLNQIKISCGSASRVPVLPFTLTGEDFRFFMSSSAGGPFLPLPICGQATGCPSGTVLDIGLAVYDLAQGKATYQGTTYVTGPGGPGHANVNAGFSGSLTLPAVTTGTLTLRMPVTFAGSFLYPGGPAGSQIQVPLVLDSDVSAFATYTFAPDGGSNWHLTGARYDIWPTLAP